MNGQHSKGMRRIITVGLVSIGLFSTGVSADHSHSAIAPLAAFALFGGLYHHNHYQHRQNYQHHGGYNYQYKRRRHHQGYNNHVRRGQRSYSQGGYGHSKHRQYKKW